jgi:pyrimidine-nucleoside phosphorylase
MRATDIIEKKRDGGELSAQEIQWFVDGFTNGEIPDYQAAAWLMAVFLRGMTRHETLDLTLAMAASGEQLDLSAAIEYAVDKHSTGGVGDKVTLVALPLVAAAGVPVAKMSGRGLGFSGGTLDKLESIAGYRVKLSDDEIIRQVREHGIVLCGQTKRLAPADGALYELRDVTGTVPSLPLIASSIMSKKLASGAQAIVLDVKVGAGAFMKTIEEARALAQTMVDIGVGAGRAMVALLSDMNQPLGCAVGNALEVREAIEALSGGGPADLREHCLMIAAHMVRLGRREARPDALDAIIQEVTGVLDSGAALAKFRELVAAQGGDVGQIDDPDRLPSGRFQESVETERSGWVAGMDPLAVAQATLELGAGRARKTDVIDPAVGVVVHKKVGDWTDVGDVLFTVHANDEGPLARAKGVLTDAPLLSESVPQPLPAFYGTITEASDA